MRKMRCIPIAAAAALVLVAGCGTSSKSATGSGQKLVFDQSFAPVSNWALETDDATVLTRAGVLEGLTKIDFDSKLQPALAVSWKRTDPLTWEFTLRKGVTFQNGSAVDAASAAQALAHLLKTTAPPSAFSPKKFTSVEAVGADVVRIHTKKPNPLVPLNMASPNTGILAPSAYQGSKINPVGTATGPFVITKYNSGQALFLKRNDKYWGTPAKLADAEMRFIPDGGVRSTQLQNGEAQIATQVPVAQITQLKSDSKVAVDTLSLPRTTTMYINNQKAPFTDVRVRQAIQDAIDTTALSAGIGGGTVQPAAGPFAPSEPWAVPKLSPVAYNPDQAKSLLAQAGVDPRSLTINHWAITERPELADVATAIQSMLKKIGVTVKIRVAQYASMETDLLAGKFDLALLSRNHLLDVDDPAAFLTSDYSCDGGYNLAHQCDKSFDQSLSTAAESENTQQRYSVYGQLAAQLQQQAVSPFLYNEQAIDGVSTQVHGFRIHPLDNYVLTADLSLSNQ